MGYLFLSMVAYSPHYAAKITYRTYYINRLRRRGNTGRAMQKFPRRHREKKKTRTGAYNTLRILRTENPHVTEKQCTLEITAKWPPRLRGTVTIKRFAADSDSDPPEQSGHWVRIGRISLGIFIVGGRGSRPRRHSLVDLVEIFRLRKSADLVGR